MALPNLKLVEHEPTTDRLLLIVTGSTLRAEAADRPIAYALADELRDRLEARAPSAPPLEPLVCSDIWVLNNDELRSAPTITVGGPHANALTAYLADKLDAAFVVDEQVMVQMDLDLTDLVAACWGVDAKRTAVAVDAFLERHADRFLDTAVRRAGAE